MIQIIGGGAVGLAIARRLSSKDGTSTVLIERNSMVGMETSSRNSEVIHAGLYYGATSLKKELCIQGREMMYLLCRKHNIPHSNLGKWIVAQDETQLAELHKIHDLSKEIGVPTRWIGDEEARLKEPHVKAAAGVLESPTTGIIDSHAYMQFLLGEFENSGGDVAYNSTVTSITNPTMEIPCFTVTTVDRATGQETALTADVLINSAGLGACAINNMVLPSSQHITPSYAKGNYFTYTPSSLDPSAPTNPTFKHLIYPAPIPGHGGLGTHLTLSLDGRIRFGPDVEWVTDPTDVSVTIDPARMQLAIEEIRSYFPGVQADAIGPDYAGIRPKLGRASATVGGKGFADFVVRREELNGSSGAVFVNLLGIESPGLTASLAIAERVANLVY